MNEKDLVDGKIRFRCWVGEYKKLPQANQQ